MSFIKSGKKDFKSIPEELKELMKQKPEKVMAMRNSMTNPLFNTGFAILSIVAEQGQFHIQIQTHLTRSKISAII